MQDYTIYCTEEQAKRAYKLGAPIKVTPIEDESTPSVTIEENGLYGLFIIPTVEQMCGWLREKGLFVYAFPFYGDMGEQYIGEVDELIISGLVCMRSIETETYPQAILAAIDAALDYLEKKGE